MHATHTRRSFFVIFVLLRATLLPSEHAHHITHNTHDTTHTTHPSLHYWDIVRDRDHAQLCPVSPPMCLL